MTDVKRMWINQPSTLQPHHDRHGELVLASLNKWGRSYTVWPLSGNVSSQYMLREGLSEGWPEHLMPRSESLVKATAELNVLGDISYDKEAEKKRDAVNPRGCSVCGKVGNGQRCSRIPCPERKVVTAKAPGGSSTLFDGATRAGKPPRYDQE